MGLFPKTNVSHNKAINDKSANEHVQNVEEFLRILIFEISARGSG
jgi:hypothetical protein